MAAYAVNWGEPIEVVEDYLDDTGLTSPILLDDSTVADGCYIVPSDATDLTQHFQFRVGNPGLDPPFPLHAIIGADGTFQYLGRDHDPDAVIQVLTDLLL